MKPKNDLVKRLVVLHDVMTPDGVGTLLGREWTAHQPEPETDTVTLEGEAVIVLAVQFFEKGKRGSVGFYASNLVVAL
jgi:hypothetical protein